MTDVGQSLMSALADRYRLERELGVGGMATVYLAEDLKHGRQVAIKVLHPDLGAALGGERFLAEIRTTAKLQHPHILPLLDSGDAGDGLLYYVMPFVRGETLRTRLEREQQLPIADAVRIAREVADALQHAHGQGIVHRDIKPENILLQDGHALVADFGIALAVQQAGGQRMTQTGLSLGTPQYMSPEQAMGERTVDARSDVYALGAVAYEMLAGEPPFTGPSIQAIVARLLAEEPRPLTAQRKAVPPHVEGAILQALEKLPADRQASAAEFGAALQDGAGGTMARTRVSTASPPASRARLPILAALPLAVVLAIGGWLLGRARNGGETSATDGARYRYTLELSPRADESVPSYALSPDGRTLAYVLTDSAGNRALYLRSLDSTDAERLPETEGARSPVWAHDSHALAFISNGKLVRYDLDVRRARTVATVGEGATLNTWLATGDLLITVDGTPDIKRVSEKGGNISSYVVIDTARGEVGVLLARRLPDGKRFVFMANVPGDTAAFLSFWLAEAGAPVAKRLKLLARSGSDDGRMSSRFFMADDALLYHARGEIWRHAFDPKAQALVGEAVPLGITGNVASFVASSNGVLVYRTAPPIMNRLVVVDRTGAVVQEVGKQSAELDNSNSYYGPRFSPDGQRVAFEHHDGRNSGDLFIFDRRTGRTTRQTIDEVHHNGFVAWSPDGARLVFESTRFGSDLFIKSPDGGVEQKLALGIVPGFPYDWSPDGRTILFGREMSGGDVWSVSPDGRNPGPVLATPANEMLASFSPDGKFIAYTSDEVGGRPEVFLRRWPVTEEKWLVSAGGGEAPRWRRDGRELYFLHDKPGAGQTELMAAVQTELMAVDVSLGGASPTTGAPRALFSAPIVSLAGTLIRGAYNYDAAGDGQHFAILLSDTQRRTTPPRLGVYVNWPAALKQRAQR